MAICKPAISPKWTPRHIALSPARGGDTLSWSTAIGRASVIDGELCAIIGDVNGHEPRRLGRAGILGEDMDRARRLEERFARLVLDQRAARELRAQRAGENIGGFPAPPVVVPPGGAPRENHDLDGGGLAR